MMTPESAIGQSIAIYNELHARAEALRGQIVAMQAQWLGLERAGGARADHAAALLDSCLTADLRQIEAFARRCREQIADMKADPFREAPRVAAAG